MDNEPNIPAYGHLAFDRELTPEHLFRVAAAAPEGNEELQEILYGYSGTFADIVALPVWVKS